MAVMKRRKDGLYRNAHSVFLLQYHIVLVTKFRKPVLTGQIGAYVYEILRDTLKMKDCVILEMNGEKDHVHLLIEAPPSLAPGELVKILKIRSARKVREKYPEEVGRTYWKPYFWADGYFVTSVSENALTNIRAYIQNQKSV